MYNLHIYEREDLTPIRKLLLMKAIAGGAAISEYTETGNPVEFNTNIAKALGIVAEFSPVQSGSGDPSPSNVRPIAGWTGANVVRCGKNLFDPTEATEGNVWWNGNLISSNSYVASGYIRVESGKKYVGTGRDSSNNQYCFFDINKQFLSQTYASGSNPVTVPSGAYYMTTQFKNDSSEKMIEEGETPSTYEEYIGQTVSVTFPALGNNLLDKTKLVDGKIWWKGVQTSGYSPNCCTPKIPVVPGTSYSRMGSAGGQSYASWFDSDGNYLSQSTFSINSPSVAPEGAYFIGISLAIDAKDDAMLYVTGSTYAYEPYNATAYGGTLDLTTGVLTVEWGMKTVNDLSWTYQEQYTRFNTNISDILLKPGARIVKMYCSAFIPIYDERVIADVPNNAIYSGGSTNVSIKTDEYTTEADLKENYGTVEIVYPLQTPLVYQLTPTEILSLIGNNVLWSDLNGDLTVTYKKKG